MKRLRVGKRGSIIAAVGIFVGVLAVLGGELLMNQQTRLPYVDKGVSIGWLSPTVTKWRSNIETSAKKYNVDPNLVAVIMTLESGGYSKADSGEAQGLMQITPVTAKEIAAKHLKKPVMTYDIWDPPTNIEFGVAYLAYLRDAFCDHRTGPDWACVELIAAGYNGGPGAANSLYKGEGLTDTQTVIYARDAFNMYREACAAESPTYGRWLERGGQSLVDKAATQKNK